MRKKHKKEILAKRIIDEKFKIFNEISYGQTRKILNIIKVKLLSFAINKPLTKYKFCNIVEESVDFIENLHVTLNHFSILYYNNCHKKNQSEDKEKYSLDYLRKKTEDIQDYWNKAYSFSYDEETKKFKPSTAMSQKETCIWKHITVDFYTFKKKYKIYSQVPFVRIDLSELYDHYLRLSYIHCEEIDIIFIDTSLWLCMFEYGEEIFSEDKKMPFVLISGLIYPIHLKLRTSI